jgi:hypothetical protein
MKTMQTFLLLLSCLGFAQASDLTLAREKNWLIIQGSHLPKGEIRINYLEAYCRPNSTDADWHDTTIGHTTELISLSDDKKTMKLRCTLKDGVIVDHTITASTDDVTFAITAHNTTATASAAHWAQPCIRLGDFTGYDNQGKDIDDYLPKCFIFLDGKLIRMPDIRPWAKEARYIPGQVWCPKQVPRTDINPRPLSPLVPSNGLIGCFSSNEEQLFAVAFEPYQELFQGVARCLHSDFRIGGLKPGETKQIKGKIYIVPNDIPALLARYKKDFPEQQSEDKVGSLLWSREFAEGQLGMLAMNVVGGKAEVVEAKGRKLAKVTLAFPPRVNRHQLQFFVDQRVRNLFGAKEFPAGQYTVSWDEVITQ